MLKSRCILSAVLLSLTLPRCSDDLAHDTAPELNVEKLSPEDRGHYLPLLAGDESTISAKKRLEILQSWIKKSPDQAWIFTDIEWLLKAQVLEEGLSTSKESLQKSQETWRQAMRTAKDGEYSRLAFEGWLLAYVRSLDKVMDPDVMAQLVLAETQQGGVSSYMLAENLTTPKPLLKVLPKLVGKWLNSSPSGPQGMSLGRAPQNDPLLTDTAKKNCQSQSLNKEFWQSWQNGLTQTVRDYFNALVLQCSKKSSEAMIALEAIAPVLAAEQTPSSLSMALEAYSRLAVLQRASGQRRDAADTYLKMGALWENEAISAVTLGTSEFGYFKRRINDYLWACRYRAQISDYEQAKIFGQKSLALVQTALTGLAQVSTDQRTELEDLRAEAYHTLANRIAVEQKNWDSAASLSLLALQSPHISKEWRSRVLWLAGLYEYIGQNYAKSKDIWTKYLADDPDPSQVPMTLFWLARTQEKMGRTARRDQYLSQLMQRYPLSFYSSAALITTAMKSKGEVSSHLRALFGDVSSSRRKVIPEGYISVAKVKDIVLGDPRLQPLAVRAEGIFQLRHKQYGLLAAKDFEKSLKQLVASGALTDQAEAAAWIYASRLYYSAQNYLKTISITHKVALANNGFWQTWPEHLAVFFPMPYLDIYHQTAENFAIDSNLLLGISRQESAFTPDIESSAGALGVMQLIRPTAKKYANELKLKHNDVDSLLSNPQTNIKLGAKYIQTLEKHYRNNLPATIAGYNAGEAAVDQWVKNRFHSDPLVFIELIPFGETKDYVKNVWRNQFIYTYLTEPKERQKVASLKDRLR